MSLYSECVFWCTAGAAGEITNPEIAPNGGVITGAPTYSPVKFDNGVGNLAAIGVIDIDFNDAITQGNQFFFEMWWKPMFNSGSGVTANIANYIETGVGGTDIDLLYTANQISLGISGASTYRWNPAFVSGEIHHMLFVLDNSLGAGNRLKLYWDGVLEATSSIPADAAWARNNPLDFRLYNFLPANDNYRDNIKMYETVNAAIIAEAIANRNNEGFLPQKITNVVATDGTYTTHVNISWTLDAAATSYNVYRSDDDISYSLIQSGITTNSYNDADNTAGQIYYYKVSGSNAAGEGDLSDSDSGYRAIRQAALDCVIQRPQVLMLDDNIDIYAKGYVDKLIRIEENKTFRRDKLIVNSITMIVKNNDNFFSIDKNGSIFKNTRWRYEQFKIIAEDRQVLWDGILRDIERSHDNPKVAKIRSDDLLYKFIKRKISYTSSDWETPAEAFKNIFDQEGFTDYDLKSIQDSINQQDDNSCYIKCFINKSDDITLHQIAEKLGEVGCADVFSSFNKVYYKHWQPFTGGVKVNLTASDLKKAPAVSSPDTELINDYRIGYNGDIDTPLTDVTGGNIANISRTIYGSQDLTEFDCSAGNQIVFKDSISAQYIGECYIKRSHIDLDTNPRPLQIINFDLRYTYREWTNLETFFRLTLEDEDWDEKLFEIFKIIYDYDNNNINITAREVDENVS